MEKLLDSVLFAPGGGGVMTLHGYRNLSPESLRSYPVSECKSQIYTLSQSQPNNVSKHRKKLYYRHVAPSSNKVHDPPSPNFYPGLWF